MNNIGKEILEAYEEIAEKYDEELWDDMPYNNQLDKFAQMLRGKEVLDVGCAMGSFTKYIADKGFIVDGIDFSPKFIEIAKRKVSNANFYVMDMTNITIEKKYDGLMAINSTIHIAKKDMVKTFNEFKKVLKKDGIMLIILQEGEGEKYVEEPLQPSIKEFVSFYQINEIKEVFQDCDFEILDMEIIKDYAEFELGNNQLAFYLKNK